MPLVVAAESDKSTVQKHDHANRELFPHTLHAAGVYATHVIMDTKMDTISDTNCVTTDCKK
jgi:hypothetical protein